MFNLSKGGSPCTSLFQVDKSCQRSCSVFSAPPRQAPLRPWWYDAIPGPRNFSFFPGSTDAVSGHIGAGPGPARFQLDWQDSLRFESAINGSWFTCAPNSASGSYYSGTCTYLDNQDYGTGQWSTTPVPEPDSCALMGPGLLGLALRSRIAST